MEWIMLIFFGGNSVNITVFRDRLKDPKSKIGPLLFLVPGETKSVAQNE
ncbi:hypothetical protein CYPRO_2251 [Cyclonatronum proteinivorum]|uniref:Uncharacterized protein n=1 Tax=Cyclonatronum proteinivorum TaxID=1457365 RepID=A0A345ULZ5_9BACT|nr:hypothetical protein CYPRO_2251 [Cyclonatronum proteinivorum]